MSMGKRTDELEVFTGHHEGLAGQSRAQAARRRVAECDTRLARYRAALVNGLGNLLDVLASAAPEDKAEVYRRFGLQLTYDPGCRVVTVESHLGPDGSGALPRGARPSGGPTSGAPDAEPVGECQCRRGDRYSTPTLVLRTELALAS